MLSRRRTTTLALATTVALMPLGFTAQAEAPPREVRDTAYTAEIAWTDVGVPHITADDLGSLGFGNGYAAARDNVCIIADAILTVDGRRNQALGAGEDQENFVSDFFQGYVRQSGVVQRLLSYGPDDPIPGPTAEARQLVAGFAAGYNQWLGEQGGAAGISDPACQGKSWVRPITELDVWRRSYDSVLRASSGALQTAIVAAQPPDGSTQPPDAPQSSDGGTPSSQDDPPRDSGDPQAAALAEAIATSATSQSEPAGSNAYGLGAGATASGNGIVLGNPHFPWDGGDRFWQSHLTIPGELDVQGSALGRVSKLAA